MMWLGGIFLLVGIPAILIAFYFHWRHLENHQESLEKQQKTEKKDI